MTDYNNLLVKSSKKLNKVVIVTTDLVTVSLQPFTSHKLAKMSTFTGYLMKIWEHTYESTFEKVNVLRENGDMDFRYTWAYQQRYNKIVEEFRAQGQFLRREYLLEGVPSETSPDLHKALLHYEKIDFGE